VSPWRYEDLFVTFHPGPSGHRFIADHILFYQFTVLRRALAVLRDKRLLSVQPFAPLPLPQAIMCDARWCDASEPPDCYTSFQPRVSNRSLETAMGVAVLPRVRDGAEAITMRAERCIEVNDSTWHRVLAMGEHIVPERGYLDLKIEYTATKTAGPIAFRVRVPRDGAGTIVVSEKRLLFV
jgi:hypothetical protein